MNEFLWLLIVVDGPLFIGLALAYFLLNRLPPLEANAVAARRETGHLFLNRNSRRGMI